MIVCRKCRANNNDTDAFCGSCGAFLEWTGEKVATMEPEEIAPEEEQPAEPGRRVGVLERMKGAVTFAISPTNVAEDTGNTWTGFGKDAAPAGGAAAPGPPTAKAPPGPPGAPAAKQGPPAAPPGPPKPPGAAAEPPAAPPKPPGAPPAPPAGPPKAPPPPPGGRAGAPPPPPPGGGAAGPPKPPPPPPPKPPGGPAAPTPPAPSAPARPVAKAAPEAAQPEGVLPTRKLASEQTSGLVAVVEGSATRTDTSEAWSGSAGAAAEELPAEVVPQKAKPRVAPVTKTKPTRRLQAGDLICGQCGEGNPPTRKFCSRCGDELSSAEVVKTPWYRKLFGRKRKVMEAGARPGQPGARKSGGFSLREGWRKAMRVMGMFTIAFTMLIIFVAPLRTPIDNALGKPIDKVKGWWSDQKDPYESVFPVDWVANRRPQEGHAAQLAFDDNTLTYWATIWKPDKRQLATFITVTFSEPVEDLGVFVYAGAPGEDFTTYHSPSVMRFDYGDGRPNDTIEVARQQEASSLFELENADGATEITIWVEDVHDQRGATHVAISELEFKQRK